MFDVWVTLVIAALAAIGTAFVARRVADKSWSKRLHVAMTAEVRSFRLTFWNGSQEKVYAQMYEYDALTGRYRFLTNGMVVLAVDGVKAVADFSVGSDETDDEVLAAARKDAALLAAHFAELDNEVAALRRNDESSRTVSVRTVLDESAREAKYDLNRRLDELDDRMTMKEAALRQKRWL